MIAAGAVLIFVCVMVVWLRRRYIMVTMYGESMLPTFEPGALLLVRRTPPQAVRAGQVVVLRSQGPQWMVKRIAATPGDPIPRDGVPALRDAPGTLVPPGSLVVLGDNPDRSYDSRHSGYLPADRMLGVVLRRVR